MKAKSKSAQPQKRRPEQPGVIVQVPIDAIDWSFAIRSISLPHMERLAAATRVPAITVWEFLPRQYRGIDGYHRWRLAKDRDDKSVAAVVQHFPKGEEGERTFDFECVRSNIRHGLPLTRDERDQAIVKIWNRWGRTAARPGGVTLEKLGELFNLTTPRIHQIVVAKGSHGTDVSRGPESAAERISAPRPPEMRHPRVPGSRTGGFSPYGRFSSATQRLSRLLKDREFIKELIRVHHTDVINVLNDLRDAINDVVEPQSNGEWALSAPARMLRVGPNGGQKSDASSLS